MKPHPQARLWLRRSQASEVTIYVAVLHGRAGCTSSRNSASKGFRQPEGRRGAGLRQLSTRAEVDSNGRNGAGNYGVFQLQYDVSKEDPRLTLGWHRPLRVAISGKEIERNPNRHFLARVPASCKDIAWHTALQVWTQTQLGQSRRMSLQEQQAKLRITSCSW